MVAALDMQEVRLDLIPAGLKLCALLGRALSRAQDTWVQLLALPLVCWVNLGEAQPLCVSTAPSCTVEQ